MTTRLSALCAACVLIAGCGSLQPKKTAALSTQAVNDSALAFQAAERQLCNPTAASGGGAVTTCTGPITTEQHQRIARALSTFFGDEVKAATALQAWRAGDPAPADLTTLLADANQALAVANTLAPAGEQALIGKAQQIIAAIDQLLAQFGGGQ